MHDGEAAAPARSRAPRGRSPRRPPSRRDDDRRLAGRSDRHASAQAARVTTARTSAAAGLPLRRGTARPTTRRSSRDCRRATDPRGVVGVRGAPGAPAAVQRARPVADRRRSRSSGAPSMLKLAGRGRRCERPRRAGPRCTRIATLPAWAAAGAASVARTAARAGASSSTWPGYRQPCRAGLRAQG